jgi:hypothetical protein
VTAIADASVSSSGGSAFGTGDSIAASGVIATNAMLSEARAHIDDSHVTATGDIRVVATNTAIVQAIDASVIASGDTAAGGTIAFNSIGWVPQNLYFNTLDALIGSGIQTERPAKVEAYLEDTTVSAGGVLEVRAVNTAILRAEVSNEATSAASALVDAGGMSISALLVSNQVSSAASAYIANSSGESIDATDGVTVSAKDLAVIDATSVMKSISSATNDGGASLVGTLMDTLLAGYNYTSLSGTRQVSAGDVVRVADGHGAGGVAGALYSYKGTDGPINLGTANYADTANWGRITREDPSVLIPGGLNVTDSDSQAFGGMVARNDVRAVTAAYMEGAVVTTAGDVTVEALEDAELKAHIKAKIASSGGSAFGTGTSLAVGGVIATNLVQSSADAYVKDARITTTGTGDLTVTGVNDAAIDATINSAVSTGDTGVGVVLAFNTVGWESRNILFAAIDAIVGTDIGTENPARINAYIQNSTVNVAGNVTVTADNTASLNATVSNAAESAASALMDASGAAGSGLLSSNMVSSGPCLD